MLKLWEFQSNPSVPSLPSPLWPGVVTPDRVLSMGQIELNRVLTLKWIVWNELFLHWTARMSWVFANDPGDQGPIPGRVISKTQKMVHDTALLITQHYKVRIKDKVE